VDALFAPAEEHVEPEDHVADALFAPADATSTEEHVEHVEAPATEEFADPNGETNAEFILS
jgi:hypothetical protein